MLAVLKDASTHHEECESDYRNACAVFHAVFSYFRDTFFLDLFWPPPRLPAMM